MTPILYLAAAFTVALFIGLSPAWASGRHEQAEDAAFLEAETAELTVQAWGDGP